MSCRKCGGRRRCTCSASVTNFQTEVINRNTTIPIEGERGDRLVEVYQLSEQNTVPPTIDNVVNPVGWSPTPLQTTDALPYRWVSQGYVNADGDVLTVNWSTPVVDLDTEVGVPETDDNIFDI